ncbi:MAG: preprotein translocase subunit SecG [bacterium]
MHTTITTIHVIICFVLILIVLLQTGSGGDMGAMFGGSSQTAFGSRGAGNFLSRATTAVAVIFMVTSMVLAVMGRSSHSVMDSVSESPAIPSAPPAPVPAAVPAQPAAPPAADDSKPVSQNTDTSPKTAHQKETKTASQPVAPAGQPKK